MKQAIVYTRFSPRPNADKAMSCEFQEQKCRDYCKLHDIDVLAVYEDRNISGKRADNRPGLQNAMVHVCKERGVLVVYSLARLARSTKDAIDLSDTLKKHKADLAMIVENIDTSTPFGRFYYVVAAAYGALERETTAERTRNILRHMRDNGIRISRRPPFGYMLDPNNPTRYEKVNGQLIKIPGKVIPIKHEQEAMVLIRSLDKQGCNLSEICRRLHAQGFKPRGKRWYHQTVKKILGNHAK